MSTKSISGVFNSPYMRNSGRIPTIRGVEVEQHLTISAKDLLRQELGDHLSSDLALLVLH